MRADAVWEVGILGQSAPGKAAGPGLVDADTGRFLGARRLSTLSGLWSDLDDQLIDRAPNLDTSALGMVVPFDLLPASDPRVVKTAEAILRTSALSGDANALSRGPAGPGRSGTSSGAWGLHAFLAETMLDFAGLDYNAVDQRLSIDPALPSAWPHTGLSQTLSCGAVSYRLERPIGGTVHRLSLKANLHEAVTLQVGITCPGLSDLGPWQAPPGLPAPDFQPRRGRLAWTVPLPIGESNWSWTWG